MVPASGTWRVSFSMRSRAGQDDNNIAWLYHNGEQMPETRHRNSVSKGVAVSSTGGREILVTAQQGDTLTLRSARLDYYFNYILTCFEYNVV